MKIIGIEPKSPGIHIFSKWASIPRLGLIILGTILSEAGHQVRLFIEEVSKIDWDDVSEADLALVSTITPTAPRAYEFAKRISDRGTPVILGGSHPTALPEEALQYADFVVRGEGEEVILPLVKAIERGGGFESIKGLSYKLFGRIFHNPMPNSWRDINANPIPVFSLVNRWKDDNIVPIQTSRGCPWNCKFCSVTKTFGHKLRHKTTERVIEELKKQNAEYVFFVDDNFAANPDITKKLLGTIIDNGLKIRWGAQVRVNATKDEELVFLMKQAGCFMVYVGLESINPESLKDSRKGQTVEEITESIRVFHRYGIKIHGMFVIGFDTDDIRTIRETAKFAIQEKIDSIQIGILTPLPGTDTYEELQKENRLLVGIGWDKYDAHHVVFHSKIVPDRLQIEAMRAMAKFYSWRQVIKEFLTLKKNWLWGLVVKLYGHRLVRQWRIKIEKGGYLEKLKSLPTKLGVKD